MAAKIAALVITLLINIGIGVAVFVFMLVAMNGFSESDAEWGLGVYIVLALIVSVAMGTLAFFGVGFLMKKGLNGAVAALIAVPVFSVIGGVVKVVCGFIGIAVADYVRVNY
jgi:hypothetical protein